MGCGASASSAQQPVGSALAVAKSRRRHHVGESVWNAPGMPHQEPLPVLMGRDSIHGDVKGKLSSRTLSPTPFSKVASVDSDNSSLLQEILTDALVAPLVVAPVDNKPIYLDRKPNPSIRRSIRSKTGPGTNEAKPKSIVRSNTGPLRLKNAGPLIKQETAATKVQKHYRGHRVRLQVPKWKEQLETVEEETQKKVTFAESPRDALDSKPRRPCARKSTPFIRKEQLETVEEENCKKVTFAQNPRDALDSKPSRPSARKSTPFIKKGDVPSEDLADQFDAESDLDDCPHGKVVEIITNEIPRDEPRWNLRAERKLTGYVRKSDLSDESDSEFEV